jgi:hypothetical protein
LGKVWSALQWKMQVTFMAIGPILTQFDTFCGRLVHFVAIWYILWSSSYIFSVSCTNKNLATLFHSKKSKFRLAWQNFFMNSEKNEAEEKFLHARLVT